MSKKIAIIGAGTVGLSTAILLSQLGYVCDLYEEVQQPKAIGAGILLQPQGLYVLKKLGLLDEIIDKGSKINKLYGENNKHKIIMDFNYADLCSGLFGLGIHRGSLFETLYNKAKQSLNQLYLGHKVISVKHGINVTQVSTNQGVSECYDMIVIANGTWSSLTKDLNIKIKHKPYPWGALWKIFDNPDDFSSANLSQKYIKCHTMAGMLPSGRNPITKKPCISFFWSLKADKFENWKNTKLNLWKQEASNLWSGLTPFLEQLKSHDDLTFVRYADTVMNQWHDKRTVVIGDAAHAMSPQLGQGANMALVDAWQLYQSLQQQSQIESALLDYSQSRKKHLRFYQYSSRLLTPFFQSNSTLAAHFRDTVFPPMRYIPLAKKHALTTLFGVKTSIFNNKTTIDLEALSKSL